MPEEPKNGIVDTYTHIPHLLLCMTYLLRYKDIDFGSHFEKWPSPRYAQFLKIPPSRIVKPYVYIIQINSQTFLSTKCLLVYWAGPGLVGSSRQVPRIRPSALATAGSNRSHRPILLMSFNWVDILLNR